MIEIKEVFLSLGHFGINNLKKSVEIYSNQKN